MKALALRMPNLNWAPVPHGLSSIYGVELKHPSPRERPWRSLACQGLNSTMSLGQPLNCKTVGQLLLGLVWGFWALFGRPQKIKKQKRSQSWELNWRYPFVFIYYLDKLFWVFRSNPGYLGENQSHLTQCQGPNLELLHAEQLFESSLQFESILDI